MAGFVSSPPAAAATPEEQPIAHDGFFPGVKLSAVRDGLRIPTQVTDGRLRDAIVTAMLTVSGELRDYKALQLAAGKATLDVVSDEEIAGEPALVMLYRRAIGSFVMAELADTQSDISATNDAKSRLEERALTADEHRRNGIHAIRDILGESRTAVELI
jgi:hypothetical protein